MSEVHCDYIPHKQLLLEKTIGDLDPSLAPLPLCCLCLSAAQRQSGIMEHHWPRQQEIHCWPGLRLDTFSTSLCLHALRPPPMKHAHGRMLCDVLLASKPSSLCPALCRAKKTECSRRLNIRHSIHDFLFITATSSVVTNFRLARPLKRDYAVSVCVGAGAGAGREFLKVTSKVR